MISQYVECAYSLTLPMDEISGTYSRVVLYIQIQTNLAEFTPSGWEGYNLNINYTLES